MNIERIFSKRGVEEWFMGVSISKLRRNVWKGNICNFNRSVIEYLAVEKCNLLGFKNEKRILCKRRNFDYLYGFGCLFWRLQNGRIYSAHERWRSYTFQFWFRKKWIFQEVPKTNLFFDNKFQKLRCIGERIMPEYLRTAGYKIYR